MDLKGSRNAYAEVRGGVVGWGTSLVNCKEFLLYKILSNIVISQVISVFCKS